MKLRYLLAAAAGLMASAAGAHAQCVGNVGVTTIHNCAPGVSVQLSDEIFAWQTNQNPHTRRITAGQIIGTLNSGTQVGSPSTSDNLVMAPNGTTPQLLSIGTLLGMAATPTLGAGGTMNGTFAGNPTFSGNPVFSGALSLTGGGTLSGTFTGNPTFSGTPVLGTGVVTATGGSTARTLADQPQLTAHDFGLAGDGATDDTTKMQALFTTAASLGKPVFMQPATYAVTCLTVPTGLRLGGAGPSATIIKQISGTCPVLQGSGTTDVSISDIQVQGNSIATYGIQATNNGGTAPARWRIRNVTVTGVTLDCIRVHTGTDIVITGNTATSCGVHGVTLDGTASQFSVTSNTISSVGGAGIIFMIGTDGSVVGNTISASGTGGDCITGYDAANLRVAVSSNTCMNAANNGIHVGGSSLTVTGNNIYNAALTGLFVAAVTFPGGVKTYGAASNNVTVTGNTVKNITTSNQNGLTLLTCSECAVTGNTVSGATQNGIMVELSNNNTITGNHVGSTTGNGIDIRGGTNNAISGNHVTSSSGDGYRSEQDTTNTTGAGTVNSTANLFSGNYSSANNRDYIDGTGTTANIYLANYATGATSATSPVFVMGTSSYWIGPQVNSTNYQVATPGGIQLRVDDVSNAVNRIRLTAGATGTAPQIQMDAADTNRNLNIVAKGTGIVNMQSGLAASKGMFLEVRDIASGSTDTATSTDLLINWKSASGAAKTQTIPGCASSNAWTWYVIKDTQGDAATNNITITPTSGTIEGAASLAISTNKGRAQIVCDSTNTNWVQIN
jgi:parallel beta-helix repeat protein